MHATQFHMSGILHNHPPTYPLYPPSSHSTQAHHPHNRRLHSTTHPFKTIQHATGMHDRQRTKR